MSLDGPYGSSFIDARGERGAKARVHSSEPLQRPREGWRPVTPLARRESVLRA